MFVKGGGQRADFVVAMDVNVLVEVTRVANFPRATVIKWVSGSVIDFCGVEGHEESG